MMFNLAKKVITLGFLAAISATSQAQQAEFYLAYGDASWATLNGAVVGDKIDTSKITDVTGLSSIRVRLMAKSLQDSKHGAGGAMLAFDSANTSNTGKYANLAAFNTATTHKVLTLSSVTRDVDYFLPTGLPGFDSNNVPTTVDVSLLGNMDLTGVGAPFGTSLRPAGLWSALIFGLGKSVSTLAGVPVPLIEYKLNIDQGTLLLNYGGVFGKSTDEPGLTIFGVATATTRKTYLGLISGPYQAVSPKVRIRNVDSPALPVANADSFAATEDVALTVTNADGVLKNDVPVVAGDTLTAVLDTTTTNGTLTLNAQGGFTYTPKADFSGVDGFTYHVVDQKGFSSNSATCVLNVASVNDAPVVSDATFSSQELVLAAKQLVFSDSHDNPQDLPLKAKLVSGPEGLTVSESGLCNWTPTEEQGPGTYNFDVTITDSNVNPKSSTLHVTWTVGESNTAPTLDAFTPINVTIGGTASTVATGHDTDLPAQTLTYSFVSKGHSAATLNPATGVFSWAVAADVQNNKSYQFVIKVTDSGGLSASQNLVVTVGSVQNVPPVLDVIGAKTAFVGALLGFTAHATDANGDTIQYSLVNAPSGASIDANTGAFTWTPTATQVGVHSVTIVATENTGDHLADSETISITVVDNSALADFYLAYGDADWAALNGAQVGDPINTVTPVFVQGLTKIRVRMMVRVANTSTHAAGGLMMCFDQGIASGTQSFTSLSAFNQTTTEKVVTMGGLVSGTDYFFAQNLPGKTNAGVDTPVNVEPLGAVGFSGSAGSGVSQRPLGVWSPISFGLGKNLSLTQNVPVALAEYSLNIDQAQLLVKYGGVFGNDNGETGIMVFALPNAQSRTTYLGATQGLYQGNSSRIAISAVSGGSPPHAEDDSYNATEDTDLVVAVADGVLKNDTDPDAGDTLYAGLMSLPTKGTISLAPNGSFAYHPAANATGLDQFTYKVHDSFGNAGNVATVSVQIASVNDAPVITPYTGSPIKEMEQFAYQLTYSDVNDNPQNLPIAIELVSGPNGLTVSSTGAIDWTPTEEQGQGSHTVVVKGTDSLGASSTTQFNIVVNEVNRAPELSAYADITAQQGDLVVVPSHGSDPDRPAQTLTYSLIGNTSTATIDAATGEFKWSIPANQAQGPKLFFVHVLDMFGLTADATLKVIVGNAVNDPPVLDPIGNRDIRVNQLLKIKLHATDPEGQPLKYSYQPTTPTGASINPDTGLFTWRPTAGQEGTYDITFIATEDGSDGLSDSETIRITVGSPIAVVSGRVELRDFAGDVTTEKLKVEVRTPLGQLVESQDGVEIGRLGVFEFYTTQTGKFVVSVRGRTWLAQMRYPMTLSLTDPAKTTFHLENGDCNGDNVVDGADLLMIQAAFNTQVGDSGYDRRADLNGDGKVNAKDQAICTKNQKMNGY